MKRKMRSLKADEVFGKLTVVDGKEIRKGNNIFVEARCECGNQKLFPRYELIVGKYKSCGKCMSFQASIGDRYGTRVLVSPPFSVTRRDGKAALHVIVKCDCGKEKELDFHALISGKQSGCLRCSHVGHGETQTRLYKTWAGIKRRTTYRKGDGWRKYGAKGIRMCQEWLDSYESFRDWALANGYKDGLTIDRIRNGDGYHPDNCRWATAKEQARNKTNNRMITAFGETKCLAEWAEDSRCKVKVPRIHKRLGCGWSPEEAISTPVGQRKNPGL